ncbi:protein translocase subunit SecF [Desulfoscipio gibsoniae]|uniref:Protein-export membrane protein SecF n=1 Tax=Desulfoscipio gibsoniae DSM 7213 TaxID=767817 RepID=R4KDI4_9FIRM|nr:protein translocase subunit SecF [Desulfoscipio gibsoniae]AGL01248.1 protein-export membrane protein, SecD/SecF family [Desulfoscipio gibsoniae DSM 7213]
MFNFMKHRKIWYIISLLIILPGLFSIATRGFNLGIDFTGGNLVEVRLEQDVKIDQVRSVVEELGFAAARNIQKSGTNDYMIRTRELTEEESATLISTLEQKVGEVNLLRNDRVGPVIGRELTMNAIWALLIAAALMIVYMTFRFEFKQGVAAVTGLLHDVLVVLGIFSILQIEVDSAFVAAILTIVGYSINNTIVIFDRVRENLRTRKKGEALEDLVNVSLWQTMARSINTVVAVLFVLLALYLLGGTTIKNFVLALIIGVTSGFYSSMLTASPLWVELRLMEKKTGK